MNNTVDSWVYTGVNGIKGSGDIISGEKNRDLDHVEGKSVIGEVHHLSESIEDAALELEKLVHGIFAQFGNMENWEDKAVQGPFNGSTFEANISRGKKAVNNIHKTMQRLRDLNFV